MRRRLVTVTTVALLLPLLLIASSAWGQSSTPGAPSNLPVSVAFTGDITPPQLTNHQDDYNPTGLSNAAVLRLSSSASWNLTGIQGGRDGRLLLVYNVGAQDITLKNDTTSTAAYRFLFGADITLGPDRGVILQYDATSARWRLAGSTGSGSGTPGGASGNVQINNAGTLGAYAGTLCTNQVITALNANAAATCATIINAMIADATIANAKLANSTVAFVVPQDTSLSGSPVALGGTATFARKAVHPIGNLGATPTISWNNGVVQSGTLNANTTIAFSNPIDGSFYALIFTQDATGGRTVTWPAAVRWPGVTALTVNPAANSVTVVHLRYDGTSYTAWMEGGSLTATGLTTVSSAGGVVVIRDGSGNVVSIKTAAGDNHCVPSGGTDSYGCAVTATVGADTFALQAYVAGLCYSFKADVANVGAASINFNSLGAKTLKKYTSNGGADLADNDIRAGAHVTACYDGTVMQIVSALGNAAGGGGSGTVTSVGISGPAIISWSNSPVTTSGTLTGVLANQNANTILAGPSTPGASAAAPTFRAGVPADGPCNTPGYYCISEDWSRQSAAGLYNWAIIQVGSGANTYAVGAIPNIGHGIYTTGTGSGEYMYASPHITGGALVKPIASLQTVWHLEMIFKISATTTVQMYIGLHDAVSAPGASIPANGCGISYDTGRSDAAWYGFCRSGGTETRTAFANSGGSALDTAFHKAIVHSDGTTVTFSMCDAAGANCNSITSITTNIPTATTAINNWILTLTTAARVLTFDSFYFWTPTTR